MKKVISVLAAVGLGLVLSAGASSSPATRLDGTQIIFSSKPEEHLKKVLDQLDLSDEQKKKISTFMRGVTPQFATNIEKFNEDNAQLKQLLGSNYDEAKVKALADDEGKLLSETIQLRMKVRHTIYEILTPMQRLKVKIIQEKQS